MCEYRDRDSFDDYMIQQGDAIEDLKKRLVQMEERAVYFEDRMKNEQVARERAEKGLKVANEALVESLKLNDSGLKLISALCNYINDLRGDTHITDIIMSQFLETESAVEKLRGRSK